VIPEEAKLPHSGKGVTFVCFNRPAKSFNSGPLTCSLKFQSREVEAGGEPSASSSEDEYQLEEIEVSENDFMKAESPAAAGLVEFRRQWETLGEAMETIKKFHFQVDSLAAAVKGVMELLGMAPVDNSHIVPGTKAPHSTHSTAHMRTVHVLIRLPSSPLCSLLLVVCVRAEDKNSHAVNLAGTFFGGVQVLVRAGFMIDPKSGVTLKVAVRCNDQNVRALLLTVIR
jgi:hypothetical protein